MLARASNEYKTETKATAHAQNGLLSSLDIDAPHATTTEMIGPVTPASPPRQPLNAKQRRAMRRKLLAERIQGGTPPAAAVGEAAHAPAQPRQRLMDPAAIRTMLSAIPAYTLPTHFLRPRGFTASDELIRILRDRIRCRNVGCALCAFYEWGPIVNTHKLKRCEHRVEAEDGKAWLAMFRVYRARGGGAGARCNRCRFPVTLCWRTAYREEMDELHGNEEEALASGAVLYREVQCEWVKVVQRYVAACMVVGGGGPATGVSVLGATVLEGMGWSDWMGLASNGPEHIRGWLEETDEVDGLRCPRLLRLFWLLSNC
ncbi:hypothetical protein CABS01_16566 [Colletotrichum abscissum]|uniref:uncharacterized protein n=1 Tax=Colletotrichum abscissum TaxID=1671311 RepID=UPI0027D4C430|nr:uncharacterized protein CABS01_16566 [Colletotrichum abscissum]KAK1519798.1 hypothetical protein CABS01_16566 [Colletotrichum abscissum]